jgi:signal transduction histidine kinase
MRRTTDRRAGEAAESTASAASTGPAPSAASAASATPTASASPSPLAGGALALVGDGAAISVLEARFAARGAALGPGVAEQLLAELATLGLVRVARGGTEPAFVPTSLGQQLVREGLLGDSSVSLEALERLRTDLLSTIAHELRTPLTAVRTSVGLLLDPASEPTLAQRGAMLETIDRNAARMQRLVDDILDLARFRSGAIRLQLRRFDATTLAETAIASVAPLAARSEQHIRLTAPSGAGPMVFGDHRRLERALVNIISNAQRFAPDGGEIVVDVRARDDCVCWSVTDAGPGIAPEDQARLFERFFVGRTDRGAASQGVGLGLPITLAIAQAHGGTVDVRSAPGQGSTFSLVVPSAGPPEAP